MNAMKTAIFSSTDNPRFSSKTWGSLAELRDWCDSRGYVIEGNSIMRSLSPVDEQWVTNILDGDTGGCPNW